MSLISPTRFKKSGSLGLAYLILLWLWLASSCWREWQADSDYNYGWIVLPLSSYFAWKELSAKPRSRPVPGRITMAACFGLFVPALLALPLELIRLAPLYWSAGPWLIFLVVATGTMSLAYLHGGKSWLIASFFPIILASTAIPWPTFAEYSLSIHLTEWTAGIVNEWLHLVGVPSHREGLVIVLPDCTIGIERACSGLGSLQASIMTGLVAGELFGLRLIRRGVVLLLCPYFALLTNLMRTFAVSMAGFGGGEKAASALHDPADWLALLLMMLAILALAFVLRVRVTKLPAADIPALQSDSRLSRILAFAMIGFLLPIGLASSWYWFHRSDVSNTPLLAVAPEKPMEKVTILPVPPEIYAQLAPAFGNYFQLDSLTFGTVSGYHFFWNRSRNAANGLYHRPDVCMPGAGWSQVGSPETLWISLHGRVLKWRLYEYQRDGIKVDVLWGAWLGGRSLRYPPDGSGSLQKQLLWQLIFDGISDTNYEVAAVLINHLDRPLSSAEAADILSRSFSLNADSAHH